MTGIGNFMFISNDAVVATRYICKLVNWIRVSSIVIAKYRRFLYTLEPSRISRSFLYDAIVHYYAISAFDLVNFATPMREARYHSHPANGRSPRV